MLTHALSLSLQAYTGADIRRSACAHNHTSTSTLKHAHTHHICTSKFSHPLYLFLLVHVFDKRLTRKCVDDEDRMQAFELKWTEDCLHDLHSLQLGLGEIS